MQVWLPEVADGNEVVLKTKVGLLLPALVVRCPCRSACTLQHARIVLQTASPRANQQPLAVAEPFVFEEAV